MKKLIPFLWFAQEAEEAVNFYVSVIPGARAGQVMRARNGGPTLGGEGAVISASFFIHDQELCALNGNPQPHFNLSFSLMLPCDTQEEVDHLWEKLSEGGKTSRCGWLQDRYGLAWQVTPNILPRLMRSADPEAAKRVMAAMMTMDKIVIRDLEKAYEGV